MAIPKLIWFNTTLAVSRESSAMKALTHKFCGAVLAFALVVAFAPANAQQTAPKFSTEELARRTLERRAVDAAIWGMPMIGLDALRQAYYRDGKAKNGDIIWWPKGSTWKNQSLTPNTSLRYLYVFVNTNDDGPVVLDLPPEANGSSFLGTICDAWQVPLTDVGFEGKGGKFLILPPDHAGEVPAGYIAVRSKTYNTFMGIRSILASNSTDDEQKGNALVKLVKVYPLAKATNPPPQRFVDMTDTMYNGLVRYDESIYASLARILNEEPVQPEDLQMMGMLLPLGIEKGKEFKPDVATVAQLKSAAAEAKAWLLAQQAQIGPDWWPGSQWKLLIPAIGPKTGFKWAVPNYFDVDTRGAAFAGFFLPPAKLGGGSFYLAANFDNSGQPLRGENNYRLHVPANVPVSQFWAVTIYNSETSALFLDLPRPTLDSLDKGLRKNTDGSVDIYFGPKASAGQESNWLLTPAGTSWFPWFRFYGPEKAVFDKSWKMPDIENVK
ncbi:DUF1254 domain-containing protein [Bradyrhizobium sp. AUGA SZCCT0222]|uniref:DUF1254 domain-containing protein n=1 Tax=Bradyrhizobium sp. AUGA SZCCT0222 TaxID=2807668 RepID=UPI001BA8D1D1|nr:DUF1254 domain-containing protein [Bradyrhizobium sp. AUGA SZCCT0222]MBR1267688.1 DUF1254 domain-containing protein [Bradyrhizobium sp. AUGA SZCCT0222]